MLLLKTYKALKALGLSYKNLLIPYYWIPYNFGRSRALPPITVHLELTYRCNLRCQMCPLVVSNAVVTGGFPIDRGREGDDPALPRPAEMEYPEYVGLLDHLKTFGVRHIAATGGEPFVKKEAAKILGYAQRKGFYVSIISNGTVFSDEILEMLASGAPTSLTVSIDGPEQIHNEIRVSPTGLSRVRENLRRLREAKERTGSKYPRIGLSCAVQAMNQAHLAGVVDFAAECGVEQVGYGYLFYQDDFTIQATDRLTPTGRGKYEDQRIPVHVRQVDVEVLKEEQRRARRRAAEKGVAISFNPPLTDEELKPRYTDPVYFYTNKCFVPWYESRVNPFGEVYSCQIDTRLGNIREKPFREIWNDEPYRRFRRLIRHHGLVPNCSRCCKLNDRTWNFLPKIGFTRAPAPAPSADPIASP